MKTRNKYCLALSQERSIEKLIDDCKRDYRCKYTGAPCIAREINETYRQDYPIILICGKSKINEARLSACKLRNLPDEELSRLLELCGRK